MTQSRRVTIPLLVTLLLHGALIAFLLIHLDFQPEPRPVDVTPRIVQAKLVSMEARAVQRTAKPAPKPAPRPAPAPEPAPPPAPKPESKPQPKPAPEKSAPTKADLEKQRRVEQEKLDAQKRLEEQKRKEAQDKARAEEARREQERKQKEEAERKRREEAERRRQQELARQRELERAMEAEEQAMAAETEGQLVQSYAGLIKNAVERAWSRPPSARTGMQAVLAISMLPTGEIVDVSVVRSSGNDAFDRSAVNAVKKVGYFPELQELAHMYPRQFDRNFRRFQLDFYPEDLRLGRLCDTYWWRCCCWRPAAAGRNSPSRSPRGGTTRPPSPSFPSMARPCRRT
jgi:colicin import membrane protein